MDQVRGHRAIVLYGVVALCVALSCMHALPQHDGTKMGNTVGVPATATGAINRATTQIEDPTSNPHLSHGHSTASSSPAAATCNTTRSAAWQVEIDRLLDVGPNISPTFKDLQGRRSHLKLAQLVLGHQRLASRRQSPAKNVEFTIANSQYCPFFAALAARGRCAARGPSAPPPRILIFGGSMTWGTEPMKRVRRTCPGCPPAADLIKGRVFADSAHCCSWPKFLQRWLDDSIESGLVAGTRPIIINLAVPASSTGWLAPQVRHILEGVEGGPLTECDLVLLDYSVNDAAAKELYADNETELETALLQVISRVAPAPIILMPWYPHRVRMDRWGSRLPGADFDYRRPYAAAARKSGSIAHNASGMIDASGAAKMFPGFVWPHPPWEQHALLTRLLAALLAQLAADAECSHGSCSQVVTPQADLHKRDIAVATTNGDCDQVDGMWADAKVAQKRGGKSRGWAITPGIGWALFEDRQGKPGWIYSGGQRSGNATNTTAMGWQIGHAWAPWLAHGLRSVRIQIAFLRTYANASAFELRYCGKSLEQFETLWKDRVSLVTTASRVATPCRSLSHVGLVEIVPLEPSGIPVRSAKVKIVSVAICPAITA